MKYKLFLRCAAATMLLHTLGHTMGALTWRKAPNGAVANVINGMSNNHFNFMGRSATIASFYEGYGIMMIFVLLLLSLLLWLMSNETNTLTQKLLPLMIIYLILQAVIEWIYFFPFASVISLIGASFTILAYAQIRKVMFIKP